ncbi:phage tail protein [Psychromonas sp. SR45-3]|uniref:phage tail-collar fiber domain-containing protein n=1 Tax=Psychromonas sp. SR45-3 TaxID=2760930 RepID=UPI0015FCC4E5|nr:phage tail protein [Psychromonas sp. SR45-3]MBB1272521.1 phage tail protein [Psychromonas sp. SR45-3]
MSQTVIPLQFEQYLQEKINAGYGPDMNEMIFAYIPGLDLAAPIDRTTGLPDPSTWVHKQSVDQVGKVGESALAYSVVIPSSVAEFTFNAIYLHDKNVVNSCGVIVHKISETKEDGMSSTKSLLQAYSGAAELTGITVDAETWQIDYQARLNGIDDDHRLGCLDSYGEAAVIDGFKVSKQTVQNKYLITAGTAYVGGLRAVTEDDIVQTITNKPSDIYIDVYRAGSALSSYINNVSIFTSQTAESNYIDAGGNKHYVEKIATINADGSVTDKTTLKTGALERADNAATEDDINNEETNLKHVKLNQFWNGIEKKIAESALFSQGLPWDKNRIYKTGEICTIEQNGEIQIMQMYAGPNLTCVNKDPAILTNRHEQWQDATAPFWWIPYTGTEVGMPFWWLSTAPPETAIMELNVNLPTAVYWRLARKYPELVNGNFINTGEIRGEFLRVLDQGRGVDVNRRVGSWQDHQFQKHKHDIHGESGGANNIVAFQDTNNDSGITYPYSNVESRGDSYIHVGNPNTGSYGEETRPRNVARAMAITI